MQITIDIPDDLAIQAQARGLVLDSYLPELLAAILATEEHPQPADSEAYKISARLADLDQFFNEMAKHSDSLPTLPDKAFTRESIYQDHD